jgi:predicted CXXCH cytochrome family protein
MVGYELNLFSSGDRSCEKTQREGEGMIREMFARWDLSMQGRFIALLVVLSFGHPGMLTAKDERPSSLPSFPASMQTGTDLTNKCRECHNYRENHHPIDIAPSNPAGYPLPLYEGKIKCLTCHIADHSGSANLLRGGPYSDMRDLCYKCHSQGTYARIDPHVMLDSRGNIENVNGRPVCLFCHSVKPNPATDRTGDVRFRADVAFLCWRCHPSMTGPAFFKSHFLVKPSDTMRKFIERQERNLYVTIPLVPRDRITCSTCHNPHQKGVILYGPSARGADEEHRLRLPATKICYACHDF